MLAENVIGNTEVKEYLEKIVKSNNVLHSYLFLGTEGIGKKEIAKEFAKKILCDTKDDDCTCKSCVCFDSNNHPDLYIIDYENQSIKIEEIRKLTEKVIEKPIISNKKVYIINNAETMTKESLQELQYISIHFYKYQKLIRRRYRLQIQIKYLK